MMVAKELRSQPLPCPRQMVQWPTWRQCATVDWIQRQFAGTRPTEGYIDCGALPRGRFKKGSRWKIKGFDYDRCPHVTAEVAYANDGEYAGAVLLWKQPHSPHSLTNALTPLLQYFTKQTTWGWSPQLCGDPVVSYERFSRKPQTHSLCAQVHVNDMNVEFWDIGPCSRCNQPMRTHDLRIAGGVGGGIVAGMPLIEYSPKRGVTKHCPFKLVLDHWHPINKKCVVYCGCKDL